ncbi:MAG TPA: hypothetical protein VGR15_04895 [Bacteroidota bacterium]|jgi:uncharacterized protein YoxC|nr:hypothetical protein [Bacteroidota bacterium]
MESVNLVLGLVGIVALVAVSILCVYLITVLVRMRRVLEVFERDFKEISSKAIPVLENLEVITDRIKNITETISEEVDAVKHSVGSLEDIIDSIVSFERRVQERLEEPLMGAVSTFAAILKGIQAFMDRLPFVSRLRAQ